MNAKSPQLKDGSEWADHEDCIVGDEQGLKNLISACNTALENGEHYESGLGDYVGVKKLETEWFQDPMDSKQTRLANNIGIPIILLIIVAFILIGIVTVFKWLFY